MKEVKDCITEREEYTILEKNGVKITVRELQLELLTIMDEIHRVCEKNNIKYGLIAGSALGIVNYKGFIPWDDDIDICIERKDWNRFIEALKADTAKTAYDKYVRRTPEYTRVEIYYKPHGVFEDGSNVPDEHLPHINETYYIRDDYTNTIALLNELGFYNKLPKAEDIKEIGINHYGKRETTEVEVSSLYVSTADISTKEAIDCDKIITDTEQIREIFNYFGHAYRSFDSYNANLFINLKNGHTITIEYDVNDNGIPEILR